MKPPQGKVPGVAAKWPDARLLTMKSDPKLIADVTLRHLAEIRSIDPHLTNKEISVPRAALPLDDLKSSLINMVVCNVNT
jgi:hypothetical protein